jgi:hypothetical protein
MRLIVTAMRAAVRVSIYQGDSLNVITDMMIVFVSSHNEVLLSLLHPEIADGLSAFPANVDVCEVFLRLAVLALLLGKTWQR